MSRYVDADALKEWIDEYVSVFKKSDTREIKGYIEHQPTIDAVSVVRCKECRHSFINENHPQKPRICGLTKKCGTTKDDWFCADGEREGE